MSRDNFTVESPKEKGFCLAWKIETQLPNIQLNGPLHCGWGPPQCSYIKLTVPPLFAFLYVSRRRFYHFVFAL